MCSNTTVGQMLSDCNKNNKIIIELQTPQTTEFLKLQRLSEKDQADTMRYKMIPPSPKKKQWKECNTFSAGLYRTGCCR